MSLIEHVPTSLSPGGDRLERAAAYALAGYWFDAVVAMFDVGFSGRARVHDRAALERLLQSAGLALPDKG